MRRILILGFGVTGKAVAQYFLAQGARVTCVDKRLQQPYPGVTFASEPTADFDLAVKSPGFPEDHPWVVQTGAVGETQLALEELKDRGKRLYGITGSNGKTTTTLATAHVLDDAIAVGNVGTPLISVIDAPARTFVIELSSFQLEEIDVPALDAGVILNITPNHLDRYSSMEAYAEAKLRLQHSLKSGAPLFVSDAVAKNYAFSRPITSLTPFKEKAESVMSLGRRSVPPHDLENFGAVFALASLEGLSPETCASRLATFVKPPHRLQWVMQIRGVDFIDDSKATSVDAVHSALQSLPKGIIWIAGGVDKGGEFRNLKAVCEAKVKQLIVIGSAAKRIAAELEGVVPIMAAEGMENAVNIASTIARSGDRVLLSPGCASFDQFDSYIHRGEVFQQLVRGIRP